MVASFFFKDDEVEIEVTGAKLVNKGVTKRQESIYLISSIDTKKLIEILLLLDG